MIHGGVVVQIHQYVEAVIITLSLLYTALTETSLSLKNGTVNNLCCRGIVSLCWLSRIPVCMPFLFPTTSPQINPQLARLCRHRPARLPLNVQLNSVTLFKV